MPVCPPEHWLTGITLADSISQFCTIPLNSRNRPPILQVEVTPMVREFSDVTNDAAYQRFLYYEARQTRSTEKKISISIIWKCNEN